MNSDIDILARTIYGEARGEFAKSGLAALIAVGNVVMNRVEKQIWFGHTVPEVCQKPQQFSCWNQEDPNYGAVQKASFNDPLFSLCCEVAPRIIARTWPDLTKGADHYYAQTLAKAPYWAEGHKPTVIIGQHLFFKLEV
ncbi:MAG: cell wall hydrolase [Holosporales bacterium]|jgi:spore germination cell wall hydrolase CwlJ-like protein|nr:cell wall hydrolase [Holosporales bacterium]